jgi:hypothetical protein
LPPFISQYAPFSEERDHDPLSPDVTRHAIAAAFALAACSLSGCVSPEELRQRDEAACASYGFQPQTPDFAACLQRESLARRYSMTYDAPYWSPFWSPRPFMFR